MQGQGYGIAESKLWALQSVELVPVWLGEFAEVTIESVYCFLFAEKDGYYGCI